MQSLGFVVLRVGLALVFIWFGSQQVLHPDKWVAFLPSWKFLYSIPALTPVKIVLINGIFEIVAAVLLILNRFTRIVALLLAVHLAGIAWSIGINATGVRDIGLTVATFSLFLLGPQRI